MTLYRISPTSPVAAALERAAERGKQVAAIVELRARFDEEANIAWARRMEKAGVHVVYGLPNYKTHGKACLVIRREAGGFRRYCHLSTGNYNERTSRLYCDIGLFTARPEFGEDLSNLFNLLTGYTRPPRMNRLILAPQQFRQALYDRIDRERGRAQAGQPAAMVLKMNSLVDPPMIQKLYEASQDGVVHRPAGAGRLQPAGPGCRGCPSGSGRSPSSTASWSTPGSTISTTAGSRRPCWPAAT